MTTSAPKTESSQSVNHLVWLATASFGIVVLAFTLAISIEARSPEALPKKTYNNPFSRQSLARGGTNSLRINVPKQAIDLKADVLASWQTAMPASRESKPEFSLLQYFYEQTGTAHPWTSYNARSHVSGFVFDEERLGAFVLEKISPLNRKPQNAELTIENGRAVKFLEHQNGYTALAQTAGRTIKQGVLSGKTEMTLPLQTKSPTRRLSDLNNLGIAERIAVGQSDFSGSSASRINNIRVGASLYNGIILAPGEEFSFNKYLGPVDAAHGFRPELVIKPEGATPEFGGGLCQVSTTAFRAAFFGGLPITQRRNHSYAVKYYEWIADDMPRAVGLDATIYSPYQDMKFVNDTQNSLLIWTRVEGHRLYFDFYGTPDDREIVVDGPHPFDKKPSGAVKSTVSRRVSKNGTSEDLTLNSVYIPPKIAEQSFEPPIPPPTPSPVPEEAAPEGTEPLPLPPPPIIN